MRGDTITIFGSTGTGKTKLSVEIAQSIAQGQHGGYSSAEIISCDSMQIYRGLDIITNKATEEEMSGVPHHLIGFLNPGQEYDVAQFIRDVQKLHTDLAAAGKATVIAGGTTYYLQHLLFPGRLVTSKKPDTSDTNRDPEVEAIVLSLPVEERNILDLASHKTTSKELLGNQEGDPLQLWKLLQKLDPDMAARWHWKDIRKISNSLRVIAETGRRHSEWIQAQDSQRGDPDFAQSSAGTHVDGLRRLLIWVWCEPETLKSRLDERVDDMVARGLLDEIREMRTMAKNIFESSPDGQTYQTGIFQTIGYKQFDEYLSRMDELYSHMTDKLESMPHYGDEKAGILFREAVQKTQQATRRYAKDQIKWVHNKLVPEIRTAQAQVRSARHQLGPTANDDIQLYLLDATDKAAWDTNVRDPAIDIVRRFLNRESLPDPATISPAASKHLFAGRTQNSALNLHEGSSADNSANEGKRTIQANQMYVCPECTASRDKPFLVRVVDREKHTRGKHHRANARPRMTDAEKAAEIERKKALGEEKRRAREAIKADLADAGASQSKER